jgi:hypothetical protein
VGKICANFCRGILKLEAMPENELKSTACVVSEGFFKLGWSFRFNLAYFGSEGIAYFKQAFIRKGIPSCVADRSWGKEGNTEGM